MIRKLRIFVDSDVVISSILSHKGAAKQLFKSTEIERIISNYSAQEMKNVALRMNLEKEKLRDTLKKCSTTTIRATIKNLKKHYGEYVDDENDAHIIAGAKASKVKFLVTYNIKDYKVERIKRDFDVIVLTPGMLLQYLRSRR